MKTLSSQDVRRRLKAGSVLVDIREQDEFARERIPGAHHHALSEIERNPPVGGAPLIFHCRAGSRTLSNAGRLEALAPGEAYILEGSIEAWKEAGLPVVQDARQPIEIMRQVQIAAGSLVVLGVALGSLLHPAFLGVAAVVGAGLVFAGATGACGMARLLSFAPWNRRVAAKASG